MPDSFLILTIVSSSRIAMVMVFLVATLITLRILLPGPLIEPFEEPALLIRECRHCGEVLDAETVGCPVCGGPVTERMLPTD